MFNFNKIQEILNNTDPENVGLPEAIEILEEIKVIKENVARKRLEAADGELEALLGKYDIGLKELIDYYEDQRGETDSRLPESALAALKRIMNEQRINRLTNPNSGEEWVKNPKGGWPDPPSWLTRMILETRKKDPNKNKIENYFSEVLGDLIKFYL